MLLFRWDEYLILRFTVNHIWDEYLLDYLLDYLMFIIV